jgi:transposase
MFLLLDPLPGCFGLRLDDLVLTPDLAVAHFTATAAAAACPCCGSLSDRVHSHYRRTVADLPCQGRFLALRLRLRRFRCTKAGCPRAVFCERLPGLLAAHARSTDRLTDSHRAVGFALGGEAGARLAKDLDMPTSPDTLLRRVKESPDDPAPTPRYVGVDDWAIRKGQRYGTILIDLERGRVLDLLPGRDGAALQVWLQAHPGVELITRDRWAAYAQAAAAGAPQAKQVADRWHLLKNLREAVERLLGRMAAAVQAALRAPPPATELPAPEGDTAPAADSTVTAPAVETLATNRTVAIAAPPLSAPEPAVASTLAAAAAAPASPPTVVFPAATEPDAAPPSPSPRERSRQARRQQRAEQYQRVHALRGQGHSLRQIARTAGVSVKRVLRYLRLPRCPDWNPGRRRPTQLDGFAVFIADWMQGGGRNAAELYRQLVGRGCRASYDAVRRYLAPRLGSTGRPGPRVGPLQPPAAPPPPSARKLSFEFIRRPEDRTAEEQGRLERLRTGDAELREGLDLAAAFAAQIRKAGTQTLGDWLAAVAASGCTELRSFAAGLRQDEAAVSAALTEPWSNGPVEGHVNRLKTIKRQMYGRAGFQLLRARVRKAG